MGIGYLLGGIACLVYFGAVYYFGAVKKSPGLLKIVKMKINKNMSDEAAAKLCQVFSIIIGVAGIFLLVFGAIKGV